MLSEHSPRVELCENLSVHERTPRKQESCGLFLQTHELFLECAVVALPGVAERELSLFQLLLLMRLCGKRGFATCSLSLWWCALLGWLFYPQSTNVWGSEESWLLCETLVCLIYWLHSPRSHHQLRQEQHAFQTPLVIKMPLNFCSPPKCTLLSS